MGVYKKYISPIIIFFIVYMFGMIALSLGISAVGYAYGLLTRMFPDTFKVYNQIRYPVQTEIYNTAVFTAGLSLGMLLINVIAVRVDNAKYEHLTHKTDGCYTVREALPMYMKEFWLSDIICAVALPLALAAAAYFVPDKYFSYEYTLPLWLGREMRGYYGLITASAVISVISAAARLAAVTLSLRAWRGMWLIGTING